MVTELPILQPPCWGMLCWLLLFLVSHSELRNIDLCLGKYSTCLTTHICWLNRFLKWVQSQTVSTWLDWASFICLCLCLDEANRNIMCSARGAVLKCISERLPVFLGHWSLCIAPMEAQQAIAPAVRSCQSHKQGRLDQAQCDPDKAGIRALRTL